jgi:hypothetical protein
VGEDGRVLIVRSHKVASDLYRVQTSSDLFGSSSKFPGMIGGELVTEWECNMWGQYLGVNPEVWEAVE